MFDFFAGSFPAYPPVLLRDLMDDYLDRFRGHTHIGENFSYARYRLFLGLVRKSLPNIHVDNWHAPLYASPI